MAKTDWYIEGIEFGSCNCVHACPCQFEGLPTYGDCRGFEVVRVERGHFGDVVLDGVHCAMLYAWPGPIFEGKGELQVIVDTRADARQRDAMTRILHDEETEEGVTHWWVYRKMSDVVHETLIKPIDFQMDIEGRMARVRIPDVLESIGEPIKSPATGSAHRVRIDIPNGIEFELAEIGSATTNAMAAIRLDLKGTYGQFNRLRHSGKGVVH